MSRKADIAAITISLSLHVILFFTLKNALFHPTQFSVSTGDSSVEVELIAAPGNDAMPAELTEIKNENATIEEKPPLIKSEVLAPPTEPSLEKSAFTEKVEKTNTVSLAVSEETTKDQEPSREVNLLKKTNQLAKTSTSISRQKGSDNLSGSDNETLIAKARGSPVAAQPDYLRNPPPVYPETSRRLKEEGTVWLKTSVNSKGRATQINILKSSGFERLDKAAQNSVRQWRFKPAQFAGSTVESTVEIPIVFQLK